MTDDDLAADLRRALDRTRVGYDAAAADAMIAAASSAPLRPEHRAWAAPLAAAAAVVAVGGGAALVAAHGRGGDGASGPAGAGGGPGCPTSGAGTAAAGGAPATGAPTTGDPCASTSAPAASPSGTGPAAGDATTGRTLCLVILADGKYRPASPTCVAVAGPSVHSCVLRANDRGGARVVVCSVDASAGSAAAPTSVPVRRTTARS